jgi:hypothetical protein
MDLSWSATLALLTVIPVNLAFIAVYRIYGPGFWVPFRSRSPHRWLRHGIVAGFFYVCLNTDFWAIKWWLEWTGEFGVARQFTLYGGLLDPFIKGFGTTYVAWVHLVARYLALKQPDDKIFRAACRWRFWLRD